VINGASPIDGTAGPACQNPVLLAGNGAPLGKVRIMKRVMEGFTKYQMPIVPAALVVEPMLHYRRPRSLGAGSALIKETNTKSHFTAMTNQQINIRLQEILTNIGISPSALTDQASFSKDLGLDSLDITDLLLQVEIIVKPNWIAKTAEKPTFGV